MIIYSIKNMNALLVKQYAMGQKSNACLGQKLLSR